MDRNTFVGSKLGTFAPRVECDGHVHFNTDVKLVCRTGNPTGADAMDRDIFDRHCAEAGLWDAFAQGYWNEVSDLAHSTTFDWNAWDAYVMGKWIERTKRDDFETEVWKRVERDRRQRAAWDALTPEEQELEDLCWHEELGCWL